MANLRAANYDNLIAIITVACVLIISVMASSITERAVKEQQIVKQVDTDTKPIHGYVRPPQAQQAQPQSNGEIPEGVSLNNGPAPTIKLSADKIAEVNNRFEQAVSLLHAKQYKYAIAALDHVISILPELPEAYVNMGYAYLGLDDFNTALSAFERAIELRPDQANAYYGLAVALEGKKDYEPALGAMRTYIHLSKPDDQFVVKARSAIWEWEALLGRIPGAVEAPPGATPQIKIKPSPHQRASQTQKPDSTP